MEDKFLKDLGSLIKASRMNKSFSQEELAWRCGITKNGLGKIELGRSQVKITTLVKLFNKLGINFSEIQNILTNQ
jgi:transcriptional regulator with XRE-family HTH domain